LFCISQNEGAYNNVSRALKCAHTSVDGLKSDFNKSIKDLNECENKSMQDLNKGVNSSMQDLNSYVSQFNNTLKIEKMIMYFILSEFLFIKELNLLFLDDQLDGSNFYEKIVLLEHFYIDE